MMVYIWTMMVWMITMRGHAMMACDATRVTQNAFLIKMAHLISGAGGHRRSGWEDSPPRCGARVARRLISGGVPQRGRNASPAEIRGKEPRGGRPRSSRVGIPPS